MASRFWGGDSDSSSSEESDIEEQIQHKPKYAYRLDDDDEDEEKRVVRSKAQKFRDEISSIVSQLNSKRHNGDWSQVEDLYGQLNKMLEKNNKDMQEPPKIYMRAIIALEQGIDEAWPTRKKLNKLAATALSKVKTKLRKYNRDTTYSDKPVEEFLVHYREHPEELEGDEVEEEEAPAADKDDSDDSDGVEAAAPRAAITGEDDEDSDFWNDSGDDDSGDSDDSDQGDGFKYTAQYFLKSTIIGESSKKKVRKQRQPKAAKVAGEDDEEGFQFITQRHRKKEKVLFQQGEEVSVTSIIDKMRDVLSARGKKSASHLEQRQTLRKLITAATENKLGPGVHAKLLLQVVALHFDEPASATGYMPPHAWANCHDDITQVFQLLAAHKDLTIARGVTDEMESVESSPYRLKGDVIGFVERLDEEYTKSLRKIDPHLPDYVYRLRDEAVLYNMICLAELYANRVGDQVDLARVRLIRVEHVYYKQNHVPSSVRKPSRKLPSDDDKEQPDETIFDPEQADVVALWLVNDEEETDISALMDRLCTYLYATTAGDRFRLRAMLCHIYHNAKFDRWTKARDLMLMGHIQENISLADPLTQILYNRTMTQLGLCAFRNGHIYEAQQALHDLWSMSKVKELLAQGLQFRRDNDKTKEEATLERQRQTPFHLHINIELIESVYYTASMLLEAPYITLQQHDPSRFRTPIRPYRRQLDIYCKQTFTSPPENNREKIMAASLALMVGDWKTCSEHILKLRSWDLTPDAAAVKAMLATKIREEAMRAYLFSVSGHYDAIGIKTLASKFELDESRVHGLTSKMIFTRELHGSHDQPTHTIIMRQQEPTALQRLALNFAESVGQFVENNERLIDLKHGSYGYKDRAAGHQRQRRRFGGYRKVRVYQDKADRGYNRGQQNNNHSHQSNSKPASGPNISAKLKWAN
eukprot:m.105791 g.105791  ORF g.105791 m.105791 type:complete len:927 (+) comp15291_c0_seq1:67-2847(+)